MEQLSNIQISRQIFGAPNAAFPAYLTSNAHQINPSQGVIDHFDPRTTPSLSTDLPLSHSCKLPANEATNDFFMGFLPTASVSTYVGELTMEQNLSGSLQGHMGMDWQVQGQAIPEIQMPEMLLPIL